MPTLGKLAPDNLKRGHVMLPQSNEDYYNYHY